MLEAEMKRRKDLDDFFQLFIENCKKNLHIVFRMSPVGSDFRRRLQMFPSLVNCMAIDWFLPWSSEALRAVATSFLEEEGTEVENLEGILNICVDMQQRVKNLCD